MFHGHPPSGFTELYQPRRRHRISRGYLSVPTRDHSSRASSGSECSGSECPPVAGKISLVANSRSIRDDAGRAVQALEIADGGGEHKAGVGTPAVFISYASADNSAAESIVAALERAGIMCCWIAPRDVTPGVFYADAIVQALNAARLVVVLLSCANALPSAPRSGRRPRRR